MNQRQASAPDSADRSYTFPWCLIDFPDSTQTPSALCRPLVLFHAKNHKRIYLQACIPNTRMSIPPKIKSAPSSNPQTSPMRTKSRHYGGTELPFRHIVQQLLGVHKRGIVYSG